MGMRDSHAALDSALIFPPVEALTKQGYDGQFGTNVLGAWNCPFRTNHDGELTRHIGHFYLTELLLPTLIATAEDSPPGVVRIVNVSSIAHNFGIPPEGINWDTVGPNADVAKRKKVGTMNLYSQSKLVSPSFTLLCRLVNICASGRTGERPHHE
jgi:retinol dehydrogenase 12